MFGNYKILNKDFQKKYVGLFYQYYIEKAYGNNVVSAENIIAEEEYE